MRRKALRLQCAWWVSILAVSACRQESPITAASGPPQGRFAAVDASLITAAYTCGNYFRIRNANWAIAPLTYTVQETGEQGALAVASRPQAYPYNETYLLTATTGTLQLSSAGVVVATQANGRTSCATSSTAGSWTNPTPWPLVAIHSALLPTGKVMTWGRMELTVPEYPRIWDPVADPQATQSQAQAQYPVTNNPFCAGDALMPDGRLLVAGGHYNTNSGRPTAETFDPIALAWSQVPNMRAGRWYPTVTALANGEMLVESGPDSAMIPDSIPEVLQVDGTWRQLTNARRYPEIYPWNFQAPNGQVFSAGQTVNTQYINTSGTGSLGPVIPHVVNTLRDYGSAVMYDAGKILVVGGGIPTERTAEVIDLNKPSPQWAYTGFMSFPRRQLVATIQADGQVLVTGGGCCDSRGGINPVLIPEVWNPNNGHWTHMAPMQIVRIYHSTALLLPDGRILSAGSGQPADAGQVDQFNAEIYSPPYLFNPDGTLATASRPLLLYAPPTVGYGQQFKIWTQNVIPSRMLWIRLGVGTHSFNQNQRLNKLPFVQIPIPPGNASTPFAVTAPASPNLAPPGHYLFFVLNAAGTPSLGRIIQIH
jgi:galactose oxidase